MSVVLEAVKTKALIVLCVFLILERMAVYSEVRQFTRIILESQNMESIARARGRKHNVKGLMALISSGEVTEVSVV